MSEEFPKRHPRAMLDSLGLRPKKKFGQNFLMDAGTAQRIARLCLSGAPQGTRVLEIGAGTGALTAALVEAGATVTALEIDAELVSLLRSRADIASAEIVEADALHYPYERFSAGGSWRVAANLPYNVATPLVTMLAEMPSGPSTMTVMVQKDVADRFGAVPGTPAYGSLSIAVQYSMEVRRAFTLGPRAFYPPPNVDSAVVQLVRRSEPAAAPRSLERFRAVVRAAFAYRRKTLANSLALSTHVSRAEIAEAIARAGLAAGVRGEDVGIEAFARLSDELEQFG